MAHTKARGFTLIEMMIVVAIVGILAAIAYPSYTRQVQQAKRADCQADMMEIAGIMERDYSRNNSYRNIFTAGVVANNQCPIDGGTQTYVLSFVGNPATTYTLQAVPAGAQASDSCGTLTLTNTLAKGSGGPVTDCWK